MRVRWTLALTALTFSAEVALAQGSPRMNPVIELLEQKKPVFGLYAPSNRRLRPAGATAAAPATSTESAKTPAQLALEALGYARSDYVFDGSMEGDFDTAFPSFAAFAKGMFDGGALQTSPARRLPHPLIVKTHEIAPDPALAATRISRQLNLGVSGIVFVEVESADEVRTGLAAMRFRSQGGTRPDDVGGAPAYWGMSSAEYKAKADLWPLNPKGELVNWTIVESKQGLAHVREIAAVKGIGVLFPGAGTLRGVFSTTDATGQRVLDEKGWEGAIQQVLAACKEFNVPCGYPATAADIEMRMHQGFSVFVIGWGEAGFKTIDIGRKASGRD
ncbi:MAG: aldolase/citrate lyase family protein [Gemmatimonadaceae bacterium]